jgi:hypothetical protein
MDNSNGDCPALEGLCEQVRLGKRADSAFKKEAWQAVLPNIQAHISQTDDQGNLRVVSQAQASNKTSDFKALFVEWRTLKEASGIGWDDETGLPAASDDWWSHYSVTLPLFGRTASSCALNPESPIIELDMNLAGKC